MREGAEGMREQGAQRMACSGGDARRETRGAKRSAAHDIPRVRNTSGPGKHAASIPTCLLPMGKKGTFPVAASIPILNVSSVYEEKRYNPVNSKYPTGSSPHGEKHCILDNSKHLSVFCLLLSKKGASPVAASGAAFSLSRWGKKMQSRQQG